MTWIQDSRPGYLTLGPRGDLGGLESTCQVENLAISHGFCGEKMQNERRAMCMVSCNPRTKTLKCCECFGAMFGRLGGTFVAGYLGFVGTCLGGLGSCVGICLLACGKVCGGTKPITNQKGIQINENLLKVLRGIKPHMNLKETLNHQRLSRRSFVWAVVCRRPHIGP